MNVAQSTKGTKVIIDSKDNIIDQLKELRKYRYRKGVRQYIDRLIGGNQRLEDDDSKYIIYSIIKYYYELDIKEVKPPVPRLRIITPSNDRIRDFLNSKDNIIDQCKLLREYKDSEDVQEYMEIAESYYGYDAAILGLDTDYERYCIDKYFYNLNVPKVKPAPIKLHSYTKTKVIIEEEPMIGTSLEEIEKGDKIILLTGTFKGFEAEVTKIEKDHLDDPVLARIIEFDIEIELDGYNRFEKVEDENE